MNLCTTILDILFYFLKEMAGGNDWFFNVEEACAAKQRQCKHMDSRSPSPQPKCDTIRLNSDCFIKQPHDCKRPVMSPKSDIKSPHDYSDDESEHSVHTPVSRPCQQQQHDHKSPHDRQTHCEPMRVYLPAETIHHKKICVPEYTMPYKFKVKIPQKCVNVIIPSYEEEFTCDVVVPSRRYCVEPTVIKKRCVTFIPKVTLSKCESQCD
jgi:hypothetical protein